MPKMKGFRYTEILGAHVRPVDYFALELLTLWDGRSGKAEEIRSLVGEAAASRGVLETAQKLAGMFEQAKDAGSNLDFHGFFQDYAKQIRRQGMNDLADRIEKRFEPDGEKAA